MRKALKDTPLREITLRKYEEPTNLSGRELTKKFLLSIGLLQPGESRDIIVDIFHTLLLARKNKELIEKTSEGYRVYEFGSLQPIISEFILQYIVNPAVERVKQYAEQLDKLSEN